MTPFEVNLHTVPHLKALSSGIEAFRSHGSRRPFIDTTTIWKVPILYHTEVNSRFVLLLIVFSLLKSCSQFFSWNKQLKLRLRLQEDWTIVFAESSAQIFVCLQRNLDQSYCTFLHTVLIKFNQDWFFSFYIQFK